METIRDIIAELREHVGEMTPLADRIEESVKDCNQLKMREALEGLITNIEMRSSTFGLDVMVDTKTFLDAKAALSAPARNCDVYTTEADRQDAFIAYYNKTFDLKGEYAFNTSDLKHNIDSILNDYIDWLFAEAKAKGE